MIIFGFVVTRAARIRRTIEQEINKRENQGRNKYLIAEAVGVYNCRVFGLCIFRSAKNWQDFGYNSAPTIPMYTKAIAKQQKTLSNRKSKRYVQ